MSVGLPAEVGGLVVLARLAFDLLVFGQPALELVGLGRRRQQVDGRRLGGLVALRGLVGLGAGGRNRVEDARVIEVVDTVEVIAVEVVGAHTAGLPLVDPAAATARRDEAPRAALAG